VVSTPELEALIEEAIVHINAGETEQGRALLERVLEQDPNNDRAWVWLSGCVEGTQQRRICLQQALNANPNNQATLDGMRVLEGEFVQASQAPPSLLESRLSAIGMGGQIAPSSPAPVSPAPPPEAAPIYPAPPALSELVEEPATDEALEAPRRGRAVLLVAVVLLLFVIVCALVATQVVPALLEVL
jgi:ferric-dicitrate binding protein FerR (iron transport regulator)